MATCRPPRFSPWEETECFTYYDMLTPHEIYEVVGSHLTETDVEVLSFLLDEMYPDDEHPLDPEKFTQVARGDSGQLEVVTPPDPRLVKSWRRIRPRGAPCPEAARHKPKCGVELLLELERRGHLSEANLEPLLQLLRVLTRHDLLPFVSRKKRRTGEKSRASLGMMMMLLKLPGERGALVRSPCTDLLCAYSVTRERLHGPAGRDGQGGVL